MVCACTWHPLNGGVEEQRVVKNPHRHLEKGKGLRVAEWLVGQKIDEVRLREEIRYKGPGYVFADTGLTVELTGASHLGTILEPIADAPR